MNTTTSPVKTAVVTGAGRASVRPTPRPWRPRRLGWSWPISTRQAPQYRRVDHRLGGTAAATRVDVADEASAAQMAALRSSTSEGVDLLVNNAAIFGGMKARSAPHCRLGVPAALSGGESERSPCLHPGGLPVDGRARGRGHREPVVDRCHLYAGYYGWAKAGINSLTHQLAKNRRHEIRVNAIAPGPTDTRPPDLSSRVLHDRAWSISLALKRQGQPADLVAVSVPAVRRRPVDHRPRIHVDGGQVVRP